MSAEEQSPSKKAKTGEEAAVEPEKKEDAEMKDAGADAAEAKPEQQKEEAKELEEDAPEVKGTKLKEKVGFNTADTTLNVMKSDDCAILKTMSTDGFQFLLAGARANVGAKSGRYMFEVKIIGNESCAQDSWGSKDAGQSYLRIGVSTASSFPIPGSDENSIAFDNQSRFWHNNSKQNKIGYQNGRWDDNGRGMVFGLVLNLDEASPNANTISLFKDGERASPPQAIPEALKGKALFPTIAYKNMTVHTNFGAQQLKPLPFKCRMFQDATAKDVAVEATPKPGKCEVVIPVGLPDQGTTRFLDSFHQKNPGYTELSVRALLNWAAKSNVPGCEKGDGLWRKAGDQMSGTGVGPFDDGSVLNMIKTVAPLQKRNYVVFEVKNNLLEDQRKATLSNFSSDSFKKVAQVTLGEPDAEFVAKIHEELLKNKQKNSDNAFREEQKEKKRQKAAEKRKKDAEKAAKKRAKEAEKKKKEAEKAKKAAEKAKKAAEAKEGDEEKKEEEEKEEDEEPEPMSEEEPEEVEEEEKEEEPPKVELDAEEKATKFRTKRPDITFQDHDTNFDKFSMPDKAEGFDELRFSWADEKKSKEYLKNYVIEKKISSRVPGLKPSAWFRERVAAWEKAVATWHAKVKAYRGAVQARLEKKRQKERKASAAAKKKAEDEAKAAKKAEEAAKAKEDGTEQKDKKEEEEKKEDAMEVEDEEADEEEVEDIDLAGVDVFEVEDVCDVGGGKPLCLDFQTEDWTLMDLRFQLSLLAHAFRKDVEDPERLGIHEQHLAFYYNKYYRKDLLPKAYGCETNENVLDLVKDTVFLTNKKVLASQLDEEMESYQILLKLTEDARRERALRIDLGDASAKLKIDNYQAGGGGGRDWHGGGKGKDNRSYDKGKGDSKGYGKSYGKDDKGKGGGKSYDNGKSGGYHVRQQERHSTGQSHQWKRKAA